jgi:hypothetical protein
MRITVTLSETAPNQNPRAVAIIGGYRKKKQA